MQGLTRELRRFLENTVRQARRIAEAGARKVIEQLAVHHHEPWASMTLVNPARHAHVKKEPGQMFICWLLSPDGQAGIAAYKIGGVSLFVPNAKRGVN